MSEHIRESMYMDKNVTKLIRRGFLSIMIICVVVFVLLTTFMSKKTEESIVEVSDIYMSEMNMQIQQKFSAIMGLCLDRVEGIIKGTPPSEMEITDGMLEVMRKDAQIRNFTWLGLYTSEDEIQTVYGGEMLIDGEEDIRHYLDLDGKVITRGTDSSGNKILLLGVTVEYQLKNGGRSIALIAGIPMDFLKNSLFLDEEKATLYSHVIDSSGNFIIRSSDAYRENYFDRIREEYEELDGKVAENYVQELQAAIDAGMDYSTLFLTKGKVQHLYCSPLSENAQWYLITNMPEGVLDESITKLDSMRTLIMIGSAAAIMLAMSVIFILYYKLSQQQMKNLVAAQKEAVAAQREAVAANMAKSEFLSNMSHDIRTPMNAIIGMTEIALRNMQDSLRVEDCLHKVKLSSKHLLGLINDVLDMSKIESGKMTLSMEPMSLRETMDDIVNIIQPQIKERKQYFDIFIDKIIAEVVFCDSVRLNQVLLNFLSNAVKFTPEGGRIEVRLFQEASPKGEEYVRTHFRVTDTGIGMSEEFQRKIFDTFTREETDQVHKITGTGLGMAITKCIVDLMGGTIELHSGQGKGSDFHVTVDLKKEQVREEDMKLPPWRILVVDDNEMLCSSAAINLEELGVHAEWMTDGRKALDRIEERNKENRDYQFVLIDWKMPLMDGMEMVRELRKRVGKEIPVFLMSAYDWGEIEEDAKAACIEGFIPKPLFKSTLYEHLSKYVDGFREETEEKEEQLVDFTGKQILLSEDIELNWEIANEILSETGMLLDRAENGKECLEMFERSEVGRYDAILMDIRMPVMNGYDATKAIRALDRPDKDLPIIAMTADAFSDDAQHCLEVGMNAHIPKPLDVKECMRVLSKYLNKE